MRLDDMFEGLGGRAAFMPYVCCGDPSAEFTLDLVKALVDAGADAIEFGIPFSDPIADGKTIQAASGRSLAGGMTCAKAFETLGKIRAGKVRIPVIVMTYYNIVYANGMKHFVESIKKMGADGLIVPDAPLEEAGKLEKLCADAKIDLVYLVAPNTPDKRIVQIAQHSKGFIYAVSVLGITGARDTVADEAIKFVQRVKKLARRPVAVGFGISKPEHAAEFARAGADGIIVGSALVNAYARHITDSGFDAKAALAEASGLARGMKAALAGVHGV